MRALLDVNVLIALMDPEHAFHERAHAWWAANQKEGWASCPITENGLVRIMSNPGYSPNTRFSPGDLISRLSDFSEKTNHQFWVDGISVRDRTIFATDRIHSSRKLTDLYLLALAVANKGRLATFDPGIALSGVHHATDANLCAA